MNLKSQDHPAQGLGYLLDDRFLLHNPGQQHPESPQRLIALRQTITALPSIDQWQKVQPREATLDELQLIHTSAHIERIRQAAQRAPCSLDLDTSISSESYDVAILAAGGVLQCIDSLCRGELRRIFAFVRPPGHHAGPESAEGFCLFNNVALAAAYARSKHKIERVAIVDMDVHHGNGTQACFYGDPNILYISTHQHPFYPGSGHYNELGEGEGRGYTLNLPLRKGTDDSSFVPIYSKIIPRVLDQYAPQLILVSAGFDGHYNDPLGELSLTPAGYASAAASLMLAAERLCNGRICFILEGGYHMQALQECVYAVMTQMAKQYPEELSIPEGTAFQEIAKQAGLFCAGKWNW
jgi:acetoin utilization deacetylase AcuC-like enzyme